MLFHCVTFAAGQAKGGVTDVKPLSTAATAASSQDFDSVGVKLN